MTALYLAAPYAARDSVSAIAQQLRAAGHTVTSTWHDGPARTGSEDDLTDDEAQELLGRNYGDLECATHVVVLAYAGEPLETWCEMATAQWEGATVLVLHRPKQRMPLSVRDGSTLRVACEDDDAALRLVLGWLT